MTQSLRHKKITVVTPCFNEEANVAEVYRQVKEVFAGLPQYDYEHIFIDNASTDKTADILKSLAARDRSLKIIVNARNFGHIRSPFYAFLQARGDAVVALKADLQDPPILIKDFIKKWEEGYKIVAGVKSRSYENLLMSGIRKLYYNIISKFAEIDQIKNFYGFGLYYRKFVEELGKFEDPYPSFIGFGASVISFLLGLVYLIYKLLFWYSFELGLAPLIIGLFFFASIQLFFIGVIGEYIGAIYTQVRKRPLVVEKERVNFDQ